MRIPAGPKYVVEISEARGLGAGRIVRVYRKGLVFRKRISSDWFLDPAQAEEFARRVASDLSAGNDGAALKSSIPR